MADPEMPVYDDFPGNVFARFFKKYPAIGVGFAGFFGLVGYRLYTLRRAKSISLHVVETRVAAQSLVIATMLLTAAQITYNEMTNKKKPRVEYTQRL